MALLPLEEKLHHTVLAQSGNDYTSNTVALKAAVPVVAWRAYDSLLWKYEVNFLSSLSTTRF